jgi:AcrR family transcriptional regulator
MTDSPGERRRGRPPRVSADAWAARALDLLKAEGLSAVQINRLCADLGVTRGSFYWHFADLDALKGAVAARWCAETRAALEELTALHHLPARERLGLMAQRLIDDTAWGVERALRDWARSDAQVAEVIAESDLFIFSLVEGALLELGLPPADARPAAGVLVYAGIGFAGGQSPLPKPTREEVDRLLDLLTSGVYTSSG